MGAPSRGRAASSTVASFEHQSGPSGVVRPDLGSLHILYLAKPERLAMSRRPCTRSANFTRLSQAWGRSLPIAAEDFRRRRSRPDCRYYHYLLGPPCMRECTASVVAVKDLAQVAREGLGLAKVSELATKAPWWLGNTVGC